MILRHFLILLCSNQVLTPAQKEIISVSSQFGLAPDPISICILTHTVGLIRFHRIRHPLTMSKSVRFSNDLMTVHNYDRVGANELASLYYQEEDYRRFREEKWLDALREARSRVSPMKAPGRRKRDSLDMMGGGRGIITSQPEGAAMAA